jgi:thioester reductase-like protein
MARKGASRVVLVTGYPGFIGKQLVRTLLTDEPDSEFFLLVQDRFVESARKDVRACRPQGLTRVHILAGDIADMHLGLSAVELQQVTRAVTDIYHLAAISYLGVPEETMWRVNVQGTANLLEVAEQAHKLRRFSHVSTCFVSGDRQGVIAEDELDAGQRFRNPYERTKFEAELKVRAAAERLPVSIFRPSIVVGDSRTGEIGRFDGPYFLGILLVAAPVAVPIPLPTDGRVPLNMVPVDYVVGAIQRLSQAREAEGLTFHLVDPNPLSARRAYQLIAERAGTPTGRLLLATGRAPGWLGELTSALLRIPGLEKVSRTPRQALDYLNTMAVYTSANTARLLTGSELTCPPFHTYVDALISYVRTTYEKRKKTDLPEDPLV